MKRLTLVAAVLFSTAAAFAQTTDPQPSTANHHGQRVSAAAQVSASTDVASHGEQVRQIAQQKKEETKETAKAQKEQAKRWKKEQQEAAKADKKVEAEIDSETSIQTPGRAPDQDQQKPKKDKKDKTQKPEKADKEEKSSSENHGATVSGTAQSTLETGSAKGQAIKEVATAKRQNKPEKVDAASEVRADATVRSPKSAARPGRGAARGVVQGTTKATGNAKGNVVKTAKPVKVGVGAGAGARIKVGKN